METSVALNRLAAYCSTAERCRQDVQKRMDRWELEPEQCDEIFEFLVKENFLNEARYASAFTNDKYKFAKWGKRKIAQSLHFKGIDKECTSQALDNIDSELYLSNLKSILKVKKGSIKAKNSYDEHAKLVRFAMGRGFDYDDIKRVLPDLEIDIW